MKRFKHGTGLLREHRIVGKGDKWWQGWEAMLLFIGALFGPHLGTEVEVDVTCGGGGGK